ncbi:MAG: hydantoinase B/oxoprolinase family protein, partial [Desulfobulbaceae bacterium]|nr:hydantoinase B/oxoprolinase family protein [Desulfobulbaceae bacterium]
MNIIEVEIFNKIFASIAEEMGIILAKSSFSSNIKERRDFSCAVFDAKGELAAQASHIPVHLGSMPKTLEHVLAHTDLSPGDTLITNDPFSGGSHLPDITLIEAVFDQKNARPLFYVVNRAHHADVGGMAPGSMGLVCSLADEGVLIPPTFLYRQGKLNHTFLKDFLGKVRNPSEREGDLRAQRASLNRGRIRLLELVHKHGSPKLFEILGQLKQYARRLMEHTLQQIPDGTYQFTDYLDDDGGDSAHIPISVDLTVKGKEVTADFSRSADQVMSPLNAVESVTISATIYVFQCLMGEGFPINQGTYQPVRIIARQGSIVNAAPPAPVAAGNVETSQRIVDTLFGALAQAEPDRIPAASCGSMNNVAIGSIDD